jgi:uncharacterized spore protein YtfJ
MTDAQWDGPAGALPAQVEESVKDVAVAPLLERLAERFGGRASVGTVFGAPVAAEGVTVVPVARVTFGLGGGGGRDKQVSRNGEGLGVGGGAHARPVGFIEIRNGEATFKPIKEQRPETLYGLAALAAVLSAPRIIRALGRRR